MLVIGLLLVIIFILIRQGRWRYFQANRLPNGKPVNYTKYSLFGGGIALIGLLLGVIELLVLGFALWVFGPYVELEIGKSKIERKTDEPIADSPGYKYTEGTDFFKYMWNKLKHRKDPQE